MRGSLLLIALFSIGAADVVDRVAVVVGNTVITESEVLQETRIAEFLNQAPLDLGAEARKAAAQRLVDQQLVRNEMRVGAYPEPTPEEVESVLRNFRQEHFRSEDQYRAALQKYGIAEDQLKKHLQWQVSAIRFTDARFGRTTPPDTDGQEANRVKPGAPMPQSSDIDQQFEAWLKQARSETKVVLKPGAFQ